MKIYELKNEINLVRWNIDTEICTSGRIYRLLTQSLRAIEKLEDKLGSEEVEGIDIS